MAEPRDTDRIRRDDPDAVSDLDRDQPMGRGEEKISGLVEEDAEAFEDEDDEDEDEADLDDETDETT
jgi:hypothetical protein